MLIDAPKGSNLCLLHKKKGAPIQGRGFVCVYPTPILVGPGEALSKKFRMYSLNN